MSYRRRQRELPRRHRTKTVLTDYAGRVQGNVSRDRDSTFDPVIVKKRQRRLGGVDTIVLSLVATGLTTGEFSAHFEEMYEMTEWMARPLGKVYAAGVHRSDPRQDP